MKGKRLFHKGDYLKMQIKYTMRRCDTLKNVASRYHIDIGQLLAANPKIWQEPVFRNCVTIQIPQPEIQIPQIPQTPQPLPDTPGPWCRYSLGFLPAGHTPCHNTPDSDTAHYNAGCSGDTDRRGSDRFGKSGAFPQRPACADLQ